MVGTLSLKTTAGNVNIPLKTIFAFVNSPTTIKVIDVPKKIGKWAITNVYISATYPDNQIVSAECVLTGGCYTGTLQASTSVGKSFSGFTISANGTDENGNVIEGLILGKGDVVILDTDGRTIIDGKVTYLHLIDGDIPENPKDGDAIIDGKKLKIYQNNTWIEIGADDVYWSDIKGNISDNQQLTSALSEKASIEYVDNELEEKRDKDDLTYHKNAEWVCSDGIQRTFTPTQSISPEAVVWQMQDQNGNICIETFATEQAALNATFLTFSFYSAYKEPAVDDMLALKSSVDKISEVIPAQASDENQLADKDFVNSSIATNTAYFVGTFDDVDELPREGVTNNDYAFVKGEDEFGNKVFDRYKYSEGLGWLYEYTLNNSSFTSNQWSSINSGITENDVTQITTNKQNILSLQNTKADKSQLNILSGYTDTMFEGETEDGETVSFYILTKEV